MFWLLILGRVGSTPLEEPIASRSIQIRSYVKPSQLYIFLYVGSYVYIRSISRQLSNTFRKAIITSHHDNVETSGLVFTSSCSLLIWKPDFMNVTRPFRLKEQCCAFSV